MANRPIESASGAGARHVAGDDTLSRLSSDVGLVHKLRADRDVLLALQLHLDDVHVLVAEVLGLEVNVGGELAVLDVDGDLGVAFVVDVLVWIELDVAGRITVLVPALGAGHQLVDGHGIRHHRQVDAIDREGVCNRHLRTISEVPSGEPDQPLDALGVVGINPAALAHIVGEARVVPDASVVRRWQRDALVLAVDGHVDGALVVGLVGAEVEGQGPVDLGLADHIAVEGAGELPVNRGACPIGQCVVTDALQLEFSGLQRERLGQGQGELLARLAAVVRDPPVGGQHEVLPDVDRVSVALGRFDGDRVRVDSGHRVGVRPHTGNHRDDADEQRHQHDADATHRRRPFSEYQLSPLPFMMQVKTLKLNAKPTLEANPGDRNPLKDSEVSVGLGTPPPFQDFRDATPSPGSAGTPHRQPSRRPFRPIERQTTWPGMVGRRRDRTQLPHLSHPACGCRWGDCRARSSGRPAPTR